MLLPTSLTFSVDSRSNRKDTRESIGPVRVPSSFVVLLGDSIVVVGLSFFACFSAGGCSPLGFICPVSSECSAVKLFERHVSLRQYGLSRRFFVFGSAMVVCVGN